MTKSENGREFVTPCPFPNYSVNSNEKAQLLARLAQSEDPWVERKQSFNEQEVNRTVGGFANTVGEGQTAVMFIGAENKEKIPATLPFPRN